MEQSDCNIKVYCRFRPQNEQEIRAGGSGVATFQSENQVTVDGKIFVFDSIFGPEADQSNIYERAAKPLVDDLLAGYNATILAYGQTSSGKTYTMEGGEGTEGIVPRLVQDVFSGIYSMDEDLEFHIKVAFFEIYLDTVVDLLEPTNRNLGVHEDKHGNPFIRGITERFVSCPEEMTDVIREGNSNRHIAATNMNERSSRSHSVFLVSLRQESARTAKSRLGKLFLVDLAGSEKVAKTGASGVVLDEARNINRSLGALGNVIAALAEQKSHVPYRDSKLTRILQESLGGNSRTTIIVCCSSSALNLAETISTLRFGQRAKTVTNHVCVNEELSADEWRARFESEKRRCAKYKKLCSDIKEELEIWRRGSIVSSDRQVSARQSKVSEVETGFFGQDSPSDFSPPQKISKHSLVALSDENVKDRTIVNQRLAIDELRSDNVVCVQKITEMNATFSKITAELEALEKDKSELIRALSELALNFEQEASLNLELRSNIKRIEKQKAEMASNYRENINQLNSCKQVLKVSEENFTNQRQSFLRLVQEIFSDVGISFENPDNESETQLIDLSSCFQLLINFKHSIKSLKSNIDSQKKTHEQMLQELENKKQELNQHILSLNNANKNIHDMNNKLENNEKEKLKLQNQVVFLQTQLEEYKEKAQVIKYDFNNQESNLVNLLNNSKEIKISLESKLKELREEYDKQKKIYSDRIDELEKSILEKELISKENSLNVKRLENEKSQLSSEIDALNDKLQKLITENTLKEQCEANLVNLRNAVDKELKILNDLRQNYFEAVKTERKQISVRAISCIEQNEFKNSFGLTLDELMERHEQLIKANLKLSQEVPKLKEHFKLSQERVKQLENVLYQSKIETEKENNRLKTELERLAQAQQQNIELKKKIPQIAKTIKPSDKYKHDRQYIQGSNT